jgi:arylformamidase
MQPEEYPPQEPLSTPAQQYQVEVSKRAASVTGVEHQYGPDPYQSLLICKPERASGMVLIFMHGGGWTNGYKEWMRFMAPPFNARGVTFVSIGYRLAPAHVFPSGFEDTCAGVAWIDEHLTKSGVNNSRLFVGGHSAGGHYAALMALTKLQLRIRGCLPISGVYDFGKESGLSIRPRFLGSVASGNESLASPILHVGSKPCPFLIAHGSEDFPHLIKQAERMEEALARAGGDVQRIVLPGCNHFTASYAGGEANGPWVPKAIEWMTRH